MPILGVLLVLVQLGFAVHAVKTGKDPIWLWIIILAPGLGCLIYVFTQIAPEAAGSRTAQRARSGLVKAVDPKRALRRRMELLELSNTVENRVALAEECLEAGLYGDAVTLLKESLVGMHSTDPGIMEKLAVAHFENAAPDLAAQTLDELIASNPDYKSPDGHLLYARALEAQGKTQEALKEYAVLRESYPGEEARVRYGQLLQKSGQTALASEVFRESVTRARRAPKSYRAKEREWLQIAEREK